MTLIERPCVCVCADVRALAQALAPLSHPSRSVGMSPKHPHPSTCGRGFLPATLSLKGHGRAVRESERGGSPLPLPAKAQGRQRPRPGRKSSGGAAGAPLARRAATNSLGCRRPACRLRAIRAGRPSQGNTTKVPVRSRLTPSTARTIGRRVAAAPRAAGVAIGSARSPLRVRERARAQQAGPHARADPGDRVRSRFSTKSSPAPRLRTAGLPSRKRRLAGGLSEGVAPRASAPALAAPRLPLKKSGSACEHMWAAKSRQRPERPAACARPRPSACGRTPRPQP